MFANQADASCRDSGGLQIVTGRAHGAGAIRSNGNEADSIDLVLPQQARDLAHGGFDLMRQPPGTHQGIMITRNRSNDAFGGEFPKSVDGKDKIDVLSKSGSIKVDRGMRHGQFVGVDIAGDDAIAQVDHGKGLVLNAVQAGGGQEGNAPLGQGWSQRPWATLEGLTFLGKQVLAFETGYFGEANHMIHESA